MSKDKNPHEETDAPEHNEKSQSDASMLGTGAEMPENSPESVGELARMQHQLDEARDKYLRLFSDFDNFKKRVLKEKLDLIKTAAQDTLSALLPVLDDFDRARQNAEDDQSTEVFTEGVHLVYHKLYHVLQQKGLQAMESDGQVFDPELHEAVTEIPAPSDEMKGKVVATLEKGYTLNDRIIRYAKVVVGK
jgi:molecular chaperone GrpE